MLRLLPSPLLAAFAKEQTSHVSLVFLERLCDYRCFSLARDTQQSFTSIHFISTGSGRRVCVVTRTPCVGASALGIRAAQHRKARCCQDDRASAPEDRYLCRLQQTTTLTAGALPRERLPAIRPQVAFRVSSHDHAFVLTACTHALTRAQETSGLRTTTLGAPCSART